MPTSSQALILKSSDTAYPPTFGRRRWFPAISLHYPVRNVNFTERTVLYNHSNHQQAGNQLRRSESAPNLLRLDYSTLPNLLKISRISGNVLAHEGKLVPKIQGQTKAVPRRVIKDGWLTGNNSRKDNDVFVKERIDNSQPKDATYVFFPKFRRQVHLNETNKDDQTSNLDDVTQSRPTCGEEQKLMKIELESLYRYDLRECENQQEATFFRLVQVLPTDNLNFRLVKTFKNEPGSFRLAKTEPREGGDFKLVPDDGYTSEDFRIVLSDAENGVYNLYQTDESEAGKFRLVTGASTHETGDIQLLHSAHTTTYAGSRNNPLHQNQDDITNPDEMRRREPFKHGPLVNEGSSQRPGMVSNSYGGYRQGGVSSENRYEYFNEVIPPPSILNQADTFLPDITLYDPSQRAGLHANMYAREEMNFNSSDNDMETFRRKYINSYNAVSKETSERLVSLGFRRSRQTKEPGKPGLFEHDNGEKDDINDFSQHPQLETISDQGTSQFDHWSRTTDVHRKDLETTDDESALMTMPEGRTTGQESYHRHRSLLDEVKQNSNYKQWKKKNVTSIRMRKELPPKDASAVCVTLRDNAISHRDLKRLVEKSTGYEVTSLQFDPVSVHCLDTDAKSQWILRFGDPEVCAKLVEAGIQLGYDQLKVKRLDDVMKDEHDAYKFNLIMQDLKQRKNEKLLQAGMKSGKVTKSPKLRSSHTQTLTVK